MNKYKYIGLNIGSYVFDSVNKKITVSGVIIDDLMLKQIINITTNEIIYNKDSNGNIHSGKEITVLNNDITFVRDSSNMNDTDELLLMVYVDFSQFKLMDIVNDFIKNKHLHDVNYITEIKNGVNLEKEHDFTDDGFLTVTRFYKDYIDTNNKGELVMQIEEVYTTNPTQSTLNKTAREVISRVKDRKYIMADGTIDEGDKKSTRKMYKDRTHKNKEGKRRRKNVANIMSENVGTAGVIMGVFTDSEDANDKIVKLMEDNYDVYSSYIKTGRGGIYTSILADTTTWLNTIVTDNPTTQAMIPQMIGMDLRTYILEKLKGNIK